MTKESSAEQKKPSVGICTLGCKVSQYESQAIAEYLEAHGVQIAPFHAVNDAYVINTCTVTAESDRKCRQMIRRAVRQNPAAGIVITGCYAQTQPQEVARIPGVDYVFGSRDKMAAAKAVLSLLEERAKCEAAVCRVSEVTGHDFEPMQVHRSERTRAYVKIEDGCENRCSYCAIPGARGAVASKPAEQVLAEVRELVANGYREVVLTGIEVASWGKDLGGGSLVDLLERVDALPGVERIRLGSLEPTYMKPEVIARIAALPHVMPHFHLSAQSGSAAVLARMRRKYSPQMLLQIMENLRAAIPDVLFTTDLMAGFCGETEEEAQETLDFVRRARFAQIHVFPFSPRRNTPAYDFPDQLSRTRREARAAQLQACADAVREELLQEQIAQGRVYPVLFEQEQHGESSGHTTNFLRVSVPGSVPHGAVYPVRLTGYRAGQLFGELER